ncbi:ParA family protein [Emticicia sp. C21]|uniref:ParA family protein n=1 Tax=Emticicia sp. C21 TaxID=2302915 RepID=UPI000E354F8F|nr:AAA family ATPase [Emticicia sp. C21]RFS14565.1 chromosome partitioning protein ParA [Emticicia sp. C21]
MSGFGLNPKEFEKNNIYSLLVGDSTFEDSIQQTNIPNLQLIPSHIDLAGFEIEIINEMSREAIMKERIEGHADKYDFIFMDYSPSLGLLVINALVVSDSCLVPVQCEYFTLEGLAKLVDTIKLVQKKVNINLKIEGVIPVMYDGRTNLSQEVVKELKTAFDDLTYTTIIPRNIRLADAPSFGMPVFFVDRKYGAYGSSDLIFENAGAIAYLNLAKEFLLRNNKKILKE